MKTPRITVKSGPEFQEIVELAYKSDSPLMAVGETGIGKSAMFKAAAKRLGIPCQVRDVTTIEPVDLSGIPQPDGDRVKYLLPDFLPREGPCLLVLEEINRAPRHVLAPCFELLTSRALNNYKMPKGCLPVASVNPPNGDYDVIDLCPALVARFILVNVVASEKEWLVWAGENSVHNAVIEFVRSQPGIFSAPKSNPRAWHRVSTLLKTCESESFSRHTLLVAVAGTVGADLGHAFIGFLTADKADLPLQPNEILKSYPRHREKVKAWKSAGNTSVIESTCRQLLLFLQDPAAEQRVAKNSGALKNLLAFFGDIPAEYRTQLHKHHPKLLKD